MKEVVERPPAGVLADPSTTTMRRAVNVLESFGARRSWMTMSDVSRAAKIPKTTVHRLLSALTDAGLLERDGRYYRVGGRAFLIGSQTIEGRVHDVSRPWMRELERQLGITLHLAILRGPDVLYLEKVLGRDSPSMPTARAAHLPARVTGVGKVLLAHQPDDVVDRVLALPFSRRTAATVLDPVHLRAQLGEIRRDGIGHDAAEAAPGLHCVAAPIRYSGEVVAALSLSYAAAQSSATRLEAAVRATTTRISRALEYEAVPAR